MSFFEVVLSFSLLVYQSLVVCWLAVFGMLLFCHLLRGGRFSWRALAPYILRLLISLAVWYAVSRLLRGNAAAATNMDVQVRWGTDSIGHCLFRIAQEAGATLLMVTSRYFSLYTFGAVLAVILLVRRRKAGSGKDPWLWAVFVGMLLLPFGLSVLLGNVTVPRSQFALQLAAAFFPVCFLAETKGRHRVLCAVCAAAVLVQAGLSLRLYHTDQVRNEQDTAAAEAITAGLDGMDTSKPLAFVGVRKMDASPVWTEKSDVYGRSFFEWIWTPDHPASATVPAQRLLTAYSGKQYEGITTDGQEQQAAAYARGMPACPSPGFIREEDDMIVIRLSDP